MLSLFSTAPAFAPVTLPASAPSRAGVVSMDAAKFAEFVDGPKADGTLDKPWTSNEISNQAGLEALAVKLNPKVGYWDPLRIGEGTKETIAWWRHAEIKHGRVAMAAFVGYCVQANGIHLPGNLQVPDLSVAAGTKAISYADISAAGGPADQWDALPSAAKIQIIMFVGFLEMVSESSTFLKMDGQEHYIRGGKPGYFPKIKDKMPHPVPLEFWDPFGTAAKMTPEKKEKGLLAEINNGRLAMLGIIGMIAKSKGLDVPFQPDVPKYAGEIMAPFSGNPDLPFVPEMLAARAEQIAREASYLGDWYAQFAGPQ